MLIWSIGFYTINAFVHFDFLDNIMSPVSIALLNTVFRLVTVCVLFPFINKLEKLVCWLVKDSAEELEDEADLIFWKSVFLRTSCTCDRSVPQSNERYGEEAS